MKIKFNSKGIFNFFIFLNFIALCCDADNNIFLYFTIIGLILSVIFNSHIEKKAIFSDMNIWNSLFLILSVFSIIWSVYRYDSISMVMYLLRRLIIIFAISINVKTFKDIEKLLFYYLIANFFMMLKISYYMLKGYSGVNMWDLICGNYFNTVAQFLAIGIIIAYYFINKNKDNKKINLFCILFIVYAFYHIYLTGSRKGFIMPFLEIIIYKIIDGGFDLKKITKNFMIFLTISIILFLFLSKNQELFNRLNIIIDMLFNGKTGDESTLLRKSYIKLSKKMFFHSPIIGNGINTFAYTLYNYTGVYKYSHNNFMEILSGTGIVGFILYYWFYIRLAIKTFKKRFVNSLNILGLSILLTITIFEYGIVTYSVYMYPIILSIISLTYNLDNKRMEAD